MTVALGNADKIVKTFTTFGIESLTLPAVLKYRYQKEGSKVWETRVLKSSNAQIFIEYGDCCSMTIYLHVHRFKVLNNPDSGKVIYESHPTLRLTVHEEAINEIALSSMVSAEDEDDNEK